MGTLYVVATPIGNLKDITLRALEVLRQVSLIAAEDTRVTGVLLRHYGIHTPMTSYFEHNKLQKLDQILAALEHGDVALVSDAGTPGINDPGYELINAVIAAGYPVRIVPGPSAPIAALVISGLPTDRFLYLGYVPRRRSERRRRFEEVSREPGTLIFLETPHRLVECLEDAVAVLGPDRRCAVARELTKVHEEVFRGTLSQALAHYRQRPPRGEIVLLIAGAKEPAPPVDVARVREALRELSASGLSRSQAARIVSHLLGIPRREVYNMWPESDEHLDREEAEQ